MVTECYIKGRFDYGVGKCAVVITEDVPKDEEKKVLHQVAWKVPESWPYAGETIEADQYNCEILAATYAMQWCMQHGKSLVNLYFNTNTCQKWYLRNEFPDNRKNSAKMFLDAKKEYYDTLNEHESQEVIDRIFVEWIPKNCTDEKYMKFNNLLNKICEQVK